MARSVKPLSPRLPVVAAADKAGTGCIVGALRARGLSTQRVITGPGKWKAQIEGLFAESPGLLILAPSPALGAEQFHLISEITESGGTVLAWGVGEVGEKSDLLDTWLADRMSAQYGARVCSSLSAIALAALLYADGDISLAGIGLTGPKSSVKTRLEAALPVDTRRARDIRVDVSSKGVISVFSRRRKIATDLLPGDVATAVGLVGRRDPVATATDQYTSDLQSLSLFLQPPPRLLSETASKTIIRAFGLRIPRERLCQSPSDAVRFAKTLGGKAVYKLVKPGLQRKQAKGAVITDVEGAAAGRRAIHTLTALGVSMGPPDPLGVMVSEQIDGDVRLWLKMTDHQRFGRILLAGAGDAPSALPTIALKVPVSPQQALVASLEARLTDRRELAEKIAVAVSRFSTMLADLGPKVDRAEIHPLVASSHLDEALALDAIVSVSC